MTQPPQHKKPTVYFDGACPLCVAEIGYYRGLEGADQIAFVDCSRPDAPLGNDLDHAAAMKRFHVRRADGALVSGARAFLEVWQTLPGMRWAARLAAIPGAIVVLEAGYRVSLKIRPVLARLVARRARSEPPK